MRLQLIVFQFKAQQVLKFDKLVSVVFQFIPSGKPEILHHFSHFKEVELEFQLSESIIKGNFFFFCNFSSSPFFFSCKPSLFSIQYSSISSSTNCSYLEGVLYSSASTNILFSYLWMSLQGILKVPRLGAIRVRSTWTMSWLICFFIWMCDW